MDLPWPELETWPNYGLVMPRLGFDHILLEQARKAGARVMEATDARRPLIKDGWVVGAETAPADDADTEPTEIHARFTIAAAGPPPGPAATSPGPSASLPAATTAPRTSAGRGSSPGSISGRATCSSPATAGSSRWPTAA